MTHKSLTYRDSGVDISAGQLFVEQIKPLAAKTTRPGVMSGLGGFGALFELPLHRFKHPILVSSTDGVGTKLKLAQQLKKHDTIGIDLVAMCVNDIIVQGAEPLFFLDYFATGRLNVAQGKDIVTGIAEGCKQANAALIGGETAEMPGMYQGEDYDLAGFSVGIVEKEKLIDGSKVKPGDVLIGIASSGVHSNGFSLVRKIMGRLSLDHTAFNTPVGNTTLGEALITPTRIYVKPILELLKEVEVHAMAHITGGGLIENIPRVLPSFTQAHLDRNCWERPPIFHWIQENGHIADAEMHRTFNCGLGMIICVAEQNVAKSLEILKAAGETASTVGRIESSPHSIPEVIL